MTSSQIFTSMEPLFLIFLNTKDQPFSFWKNVPLSTNMCTEDPIGNVAHVGCFMENDQNTKNLEGK